MKNWLLSKDPDAGQDWRQEETGTTEDEIVGWHHQLNGCEFKQALGVGEIQGNMVWYSPWGQKELDMTEPTDWLTGSPQDAVDLIANYILQSLSFILSVVVARMSPWCQGDFAWTWLSLVTCMTLNAIFTCWQPPFLQFLKQEQSGWPCRTVRKD